MNWIKARLKENSTLFGFAMLIFIGSGVDLSALESMPKADAGAIIVAIMSMLKGD